MLIMGSLLGIGGINAVRVFLSLYFPYRVGSKLGYREYEDAEDEEAA